MEVDIAWGKIYYSGMERPFPINGIFPSIQRALHLPDRKTAVAPRDLTRSVRAEILKRVLGVTPKPFASSHASDSDLQTWMNLNLEYGPDAVSDAFKAGLIPQRVVMSFSGGGSKNEKCSNEEALNNRLKWLEEKGKQFGWIQDSPTK